MNKVDLFVIGGGINGTGIAADAALRGLEVALCEQDDLANHTSSQSSKLIHGGLRYLEEYEFRLVREALQEREVLLKVAPHLIRPLQFIMPHNSHLRPSWLIRLGLFLYDHLNWRQSLPKTKFLHLGESNPLQASYRKAYSYYDCATDDARLVVANALQAQAHSATILTRHQVLNAKRQEGAWLVEVVDRHTKAQRQFYAKALVNASGPWVSEILTSLKQESQHQVRLVKGSHIVVPKLYEGEWAYILQNDDRRIVFVIPYLERFSLVGTTDVPVTGSPTEQDVSAAEQDYLCAIVNRYFKKPITPKDIVWQYWGVRPLQSDQHANPSEVTRDYALELHDEQGQLPLLSIFGGKITTYRELAKRAIERLEPYFSALKPCVTDKVPLPGGDMPSFMTGFQSFKTQFDFLPEGLLRRWFHAYGTRAYIFLKDVRSESDLGEHFGAGLYACEVQFLVATEWAKTAEDILWRRTKLGLFMSQAEQRTLASFLS